MAIESLVVLEGRVYHGGIEFYPTGVEEVGTVSLVTGYFGSEVALVGNKFWPVLLGGWYFCIQLMGTDRQGFVIGFRSDGYYFIFRSISMEGGIDKVRQNYLEWLARSVYPLVEMERKKLRREKRQGLLPYRPLIPPKS